jgi:hypothetical protein
MSDKTVLTKEQRAALCDEERCKEHGDGDEWCPIPLYKEDLNDLLSDAQDTSTPLQEQAEPKTATGHVVRSDE